MIERYSTPSMSAVWSEQRKLAVWREVEVLVVEAWVELGTAPPGAAAAARERCDCAPVLSFFAQHPGGKLLFALDISSLLVRGFACGQQAKVGPTLAAAVLELLR